MIVGDYVEDYEAMVPYQMLVMVGHEVSTVSPGKKPGDYVVTAIHDFEGHQTYSEKPGHRFAINYDFDKHSAQEFGKAYDGLVIPGGRAPEFLRLNEKVLDIVRSFFASNKPVAAWCHGPQILSAAGVMKNRSCIAYPTLKPELESCGAAWGKISETNDNAHVDGNLVTAVAWPGHPQLIARFLELLGTKVHA